MDTSSLHKIMLKYLISFQLKMEIIYENKILFFSRSYMKNMDGSKSRLGQMLDKFQLKKQQQAEVVNLADESDPIVSR